MGKISIRDMFDNTISVASKLFIFAF